MISTTGISLIPLVGIPSVRPGDDLDFLVAQALTSIGGLQDDDIVVVAQKIVSKSEGRYVRLSDIAPSARATEVAEGCGKDPRLVEVVLSESTDIVRNKPGVLIVRNRHGHVMANAGVDQSNVDQGNGETVLLLPVDPDHSASRLKSGLDKWFGVSCGIVIADSFGRPWRNGTTGTCIGAAGVTTLKDLRGLPDLYGRQLMVSQQAFGDETAAAASLLMGQGQEGIPAVVLRGLTLDKSGSSRDLIRPKELDLFT